MLFAVDRRGRLVDTVRIPGAENTDWEDLEAADCPAGRCLYLGDVGDNAERRRDVVLYRMVEPGPGDDPRARIDVFPVRFPDGPRDVEALFVLPGQRIHLVTKGRNHPVTVYRYPLPLRPGEEVTLEEVQRLTSGPAGLPDHVTGAAADSRGRTVVVRSYSDLRFYGVEEGRLRPLHGGALSLRTLREAQGEAVTFAPGGRLVLASEAGPWGRRGGLRLLRCPGISGGE